MELIERIDMSKVRQICINENWCTFMTKKEYDDLDKFKDMPVKEAILALSAKIAAKSDFDERDLSGNGMTAEEVVAGKLFRNAVLRYVKTAQQEREENSDKTKNRGELDALFKAKQMMKKFVNIYADDLPNFAEPEAVAKDIAEGLALFDMLSFKDYLAENPDLDNHRAEFQLENAFDLEDKSSEFRFKRQVNSKLIQGIAKVILDNDKKRIDAMIDGLFSKDRVKEIDKLKNLTYTNERH